LKGYGVVRIEWSMDREFIEFLGQFFEVMKNSDVMELNGPRIWIQRPRKHMIDIVRPQG